MQSTVDTAKKIADTPQTDNWSLDEAVQRLPKPIRVYLFSDRLERALDELDDRYGLTEDESNEIFLQIMYVLSGRTQLQALPDIIWSRLSWDDKDEERGRALVADILGLIFLPVQTYIGDVVGLILAYGGNPKKYPQEQVEFRTVVIGDAVKTIIGASGLDGLPQPDFNRLARIVENRLRDIRDDAETRQTLMKARKVGGLDMPQEQVDRLMRAIAGEMSMTKFVDAQVQFDKSDRSQEPSDKATPSVEQIKVLLLGSVEEQKEMAKRIGRIIDEGGNNAEMTREMLYTQMIAVGADSPAPLDVAATLMVLARQNGLIGALTADDRYQEAVRTYLESIGAKDELNTVQEKPTGRDGINIFLQIVLRGVAQLKEEDAARYGLRILNTLKKQGNGDFRDLVAFDLDQGKFVWTEPIQI